MVDEKKVKEDQETRKKALRRYLMGFTKRRRMRR